MTTDSSALARPPGSTAEDDYQSFCAALSESARGREFLAEYARRNRHADTGMLLAGIDRLESLMRADGSALERLRDELRMLLIAIRLARPGIDAAGPLTKAAKLANLLDMLERRLEAMAESKAGGEAPAPEAAPAAVERLPLSVVPPSDEPELPIPAPPGAEPPPPISLVRAAMPEVAFVFNAPLGPPVTEAAAIAKPLSEPPPTATPAPPSADSLAAMMALSEEERIALFT